MWSPTCRSWTTREYFDLCKCLCSIAHLIRCDCFVFRSPGVLSGMLDFYNHRCKCSLHCRCRDHGIDPFLILCRYTPVNDTLNGTSKYSVLPPNATVFGRLPPGAVVWGYGAAILSQLPDDSLLLSHTDLTWNSVRYQQVRQPLQSYLHVYCVPHSRKISDVV